MPSKGFSKEYGFHINRPFYFVSRLPFKRVAEGNGSNITLRRWRKNVQQQVWFFNGQDKMIRSNYWKNYCLEIPGNGGQNELRMTSNCKSRWW
jgi:hypothetical protein